MTDNIFTPGPTPNSVRTSKGQVQYVDPLGSPQRATARLAVLAACLRDRSLSGRVDSSVVWRCGPSSTGEGRRRPLGGAGEERQKVFSRGVWASAETIERIRAELDVERSTKSFAKRRHADAKRREKAQIEYVEDFTGAVLAFLAFHLRHADLAQRLAQAVADHATPVGSGTVARTKRIPIEQRAEAAVIAWMRHQTTAYDSMVIPRVKGNRREVRRVLAQRSKELLARYRRGEAGGEECPLVRALGELPLGRTA